MINIRTDLALEMHEFLRQEATKIPSCEPKGYVSGVEVFNDGDKDVKITRVKITSKEGEEKIGKPMGNYITIEVPKIKEQEPVIHEKAYKQLSKELERLIKIDKKGNVLIIGLGNKDITSDSLGPMVVSKLMITRHLLQYMPEALDEGVRPVCAVATGVLGTTGIETFEIVKGIVEKVNPQLVIVVDALAARSTSRISTTIQIADTGIAPGSGVGNKRKELSQNTLNIPVISIGVPTIIDKNTMVSDVIDNILERVSANINREEREDIINRTVAQDSDNLMVTPKEIDDLIDKISKVVANGLNLALHEGITLEYVNRYM